MQAASCLSVSTQEGSSSAQLCHAVFSVYMVGIHVGDCRSVPSTGFTLSLPPSSPYPPPCVFCTQAVGRQGQSPWDTVGQAVWCSPTVQRKRDQRGPTPFRQQEAEEILLLVDVTLNVRISGEGTGVGKAAEVGACWVLGTSLLLPHDSQQSLCGEVQEALGRFADFEH